MQPPARPLRRGFLQILGLWLLLLLADLGLRSSVSNNASPFQWRPLDAGVYLLGAIWGAASWYLLSHLLGLFSADVTGRDFKMEPATLFDMVGKNEIVKPTLEVIYDAA